MSDLREDIEHHASNNNLLRLLIYPLVYLIIALISYVLTGIFINEVNIITFFVFILMFIDFLFRVL